MVMTILKRAFNVLMKKPLKLWGISLLNVVLVFLANVLFGVIPGASLALTMLLNTSMTMIFLKGFRGEDSSVVNLFDCFKSWDTAKRVVLGSGWTALWIFLWGLIPVVGPIFAIIKTYAYSLTPYILVTEPNIPLLDAYKVSEQRTMGYKGKMFGAEILVYLAIGLASGLLSALSGIKVIGVLFALVYVVLTIAVSALLPLFMGLIKAAFYEEITHPTQPVYAAPGYMPPQAPGQVPPQAPTGNAFCSNCGAPIPEGSAFCTNCGTPR